MLARMIFSSKSSKFPAHISGFGFKVLILILSLAVSPCLRGEFLHPPSSQEQTQPSGQEAIAHSVVDAIEKNYLRAHPNPLWNIARDKLLAGKYKNAAEVFHAAQEQLPFLEDPELNLLTPDQITAVQQEAFGEKIGSGLADFCVDLQVETGRARIVTPLMGSPAMKAGVQPGDVLISINGKLTSEMNHEQVMEALRSSAPGGIALQIERGEGTVKAVVQPSSEKLETLQVATKRISGKNIGYIRISLFPPAMGQKAREAIARMEQSNVDGYILDLRNNPGGFLNSARDVAGLFATGTLGYKVRSNHAKEAIEVKGSPVTKKPLAVLINVGSASAAEFLAGALQGVHRATLVGSRSYGRGQAQIFVELAEGYGIQIPSVQLLTPNGEEFKGKGIAPDVEVAQPQIPENELTGPKDKQFLRAVASLSAQ